jgi:hypothetical protein
VAPPGGEPQAAKFAGGHRIRVTPVPIPNTEVKPDTADGTVWETVWESRSLPALITATAKKPASLTIRGLFSVYGQLRIRNQELRMRTDVSRSAIATAIGISQDMYEFSILNS